MFDRSWLGASLGTEFKTLRGVMKERRWGPWYLEVGKPPCVGGGNLGSFLPDFWIVRKELVCILEVNLRSC